MNLHLKESIISQELGEKAMTPKKKSEKKSEEMQEQGNIFLLKKLREEKRPQLWKQ